MKNKLLLAALTLGTTFSLCCCGSNPSGTGIHFGEDVTLFYRPILKTNSNEAEAFFALIEFENEPEEGLMWNGDGIYYGGEYKVLKNFSENEIVFNTARIIFGPEVLTGIKTEHDDNSWKELFRQYFSTYKTYLVYLHDYPTSYDGITGERLYGDYIDGDGNSHHINFDYCYITRSQVFFEAIPVVDSKIQLSVVQSFANECYELCNYKPLGRALRLELLFEDGDDVYEDFPQKLNYYVEHYDELVESQFSLYK